MFGIFDAGEVVFELHEGVRIVFGFDEKRFLRFGRWLIVESFFGLLEDGGAVVCGFPKRLGELSHANE